MLGCLPGPLVLFSTGSAPPSTAADTSLDVVSSLGLPFGRPFGPLRPSRLPYKVRLRSCQRSAMVGESERHTVRGPLYKDFWYFSASLMQEVWPLYCAGPSNVVLQSMHVNEEWQRDLCWSSFGFLTTSEQPEDRKDSCEHAGCGLVNRSASNVKNKPSHLPKLVRRLVSQMKARMTY